MELKLEPWERVPERLAPMLASIDARKFPVLPEEPELGKYYRVYPGAGYSAKGEPFHACLKLGQVSDKLLIFFGGGGVSWNEYTAARPNNLFTGHLEQSHYFNDLEWMGDLLPMEGICSDREDNPFRDWNILVIPYATGDFHCGAGNFPYMALDGSHRELCHHGYLNTCSLIQQVKHWVGSPKTLVIAGNSAGAFGVTLMADDIIAEFPDCNDITCVPDSALLISRDWRRIAREVWHSPVHICDRLTGNNIALDSYTALYQKYGDRLRYLYICSVRDALLASCQNALDGGKLIYNKEMGERFQKDLTEMCHSLIRQIPGIGLYLFSAPWSAPGYEAAELTEHCVLGTPLMYTLQEEGRTPCDWLCDALTGNVSQIGMAYLNGEGNI